MRTLPLILLGACTAAAPNRVPTPQPTDGSCLEGLDVGDCAPDFELLNADGTPVRLSEQFGSRVVVVGSSLW